MATTALTHPKMFAYFDKTRYEEYAFQHMVGLSSLVILASDTLNTKLMLPWLQCVLTEASAGRCERYHYIHIYTWCRPASTLSAPRTPAAGLTRSRSSATAAAIATTCPPSTSCWASSSASR